MSEGRVPDGIEGQSLELDLPLGERGKVLESVEGHFLVELDVLIADELEPKRCYTRRHGVEAGCLVVLGWGGAFGAPADDQ